MEVIHGPIGKPLQKPLLVIVHVTQSLISTRSCLIQSQATWQAEQKLRLRIAFKVSTAGLSQPWCLKYLTGGSRGCMLSAYKAYELSYCTVAAQ